MWSFKRRSNEVTDMNPFKLALMIRKKVRAIKPEEGHAKKANTTPKRFVREFRGS